MNELTVVGVRVELPANQPIVLLKEAAGERYLPIWIGAVEATAIAFAQQGIVPPRPMTHDLLRDVLQALGARLEAVNITELREGVYYAELARFGIEARHLRAFKTAADREIGLVEQVIAPLVRQRNPEARARADEVARELAALSVRLHATLVKAGLRPGLSR